MLFLLFLLDSDRYALDASRVVEVLPLLDIKRLPHAPKGVAGVFNYRGQPIPAVDLCQLTLGQRAAERMSTRIVVVSYRRASGSSQLLGLIAENVTEVIRRNASEFVSTGVKIGAAPYLGPVLIDAGGTPIQWLQEQHLLSEPIEHFLMREPALLQEFNPATPTAIAADQRDIKREA